MTVTFQVGSPTLIEVVLHMMKGLRSKISQAINLGGIEEQRNAGGITVSSA